jgi:[NiFe] hydrogenase diaphorase moiety large subunit
MVVNNLREPGAVVFAPSTPGVALQRALSEQPVELIKIVKASRLRGRGGAGFPTGMKWEFTRGAAGERKFVVCNADEGEPGTFKDRVILTEAAGLMFEGMTIAGYAIGASEGIVYLRGEYAYLLQFLEEILAKRRAAGLARPRHPGQVGIQVRHPHSARRWRLRVRRGNRAAQLVRRQGGRSQDPAALSRRKRATSACRR